MALGVVFQNYTSSGKKYLEYFGLVLALLLSYPLVAQGQDRVAREQGIPFPNAHYGPETYGQHPQNWDIVQDDRGLVYVANNHGVLEYDGERWRTIKIKTEAFVRSVAADSLVYVGATGDFGVLRPDSSGTLRYNSLTGKLDERKQDFGDVWNTHATKDGVYFQANERLFRWDGTELKSWTSEGGFHTSFVVRDRFFVRDFERGLVEVTGDSLRSVPQGKVFHETPIYMMAPYPGDRILIGTQNRGLLLYDGNTLEDFAPAVTSYLQNNNFYHGTALPDGRYALATLGGGVVVIDRNGGVDQVLDDELPDTVVNRLFAAPDGTLWMALNNGGIFRGHVGNAVSIFDERSGLQGVIEDIERHDQRLLAATGAGLYELGPSPDQNGLGTQWAFRKAGEMPVGKELLPLKNGLLLATQEGIFYRDANRTWSDSIKIQTFDLHLARNGSTVYAGVANGLLKLQSVNGDWSAPKIKGINDQIRITLEDKPGILWVSNKKGDIGRIQLSSNNRLVKQKKWFGKKHGLSEGLKYLTQVDGEVLIVAKGGVFRIWENTEHVKFERVPDLLPDEEESADLEIQTLKEDPNGDLWFARGDQVFRGRKTGTTSYEWTSIAGLHFPKADVNRIHVEENGVVWFGSGKRLFRYDSNARTVPPPTEDAFRTIVRKVTEVGTKRTLYGGAPRPASDSVLSIPYADNDIRVQVAAPFYAAPGEQEYQFRLAGADREWSDWTDTARATYTNLHEGTYELEARARTETGLVSRASHFTLRVHPPWYRTVWAYLIYTGLFGVVALGAYRLYQLRQARQRARERARELRRERIAKQRLEEANEQLREANRLKEEFLANMSHELRTPLTNILGFTGVLRESATEEQKRHLDSVEKNGERLLDTFNALLDLANLRSGDVDLELEPVNVSKRVQAAVGDIDADRRDAKDLELRVHVPDEPVYGTLDPGYFDQVLYNLLDNAVKFTDQGYVAAAVEPHDEYVEVAVMDTGIGIDESFLPEIFDDFKQESRGMAREYEGNGLGLAITERLVELMDGEIFVESTKGEGSTFTVRFPRADGKTTRTGSDERTQHETPVPVV